MNFAFTEEQEELRKTVRSFLEAKSPESAVREQMETEVGFDQAVWSQMGEQMGLQGLAIPAFAKSQGASTSSRELRRKSRSRHPHFSVARARGFDPASTLTAMDIEGIDVAVMYGTRGRQILCHDDLKPDYAAALARAYNNWAHD